MKRATILAGIIVGLVAVTATGIWAANRGRFPLPSVPNKTITTNQAVVKWEDTKHVDHFTIRLYRGSQGKHLNATYHINGNKSQWALTALKPDNTYYVKIKAYYNNGEASLYSKRVKFRTDLPPEETADSNTTEDAIVDDTSTTDGITNNATEADTTNTTDQTNSNTNTSNTVVAPVLSAAYPLQTGVNFISLSDIPGTMADFEEIGVQVVRQLSTHDVLWSTVEPSNDQWDFSDSDTFLEQTTVEPVVTLFRYQYASATPPWATINSPFEKIVGPEAEEYITTLVERYKDKVTYWEIGNEMDHWIALDGDAAVDGANNPPAYTEGETFTPEEQGVFLSQVANIIRAHDPTAVIVLPGMGGISDYTLGTWLPGVVAGGGTAWFDVVNYHYYSSWQRLSAERPALTAKMAELNITNKAVWLSETGSSADPTLTTRTNYPNSQATQAADVFRRLTLGYGNGDDSVIWHTYSGEDSSDNTFRQYGVYTDQLAPRLAVYSYRLFTDELIPFHTIERIDTGSNQDYIYKYTRTDGKERYVAWSNTNSAWTPPSTMTQYASVVSDAQGAFYWNSLTSETSVALSSTPILLK